MEVTTAMSNNTQEQRKEKKETRTKIIGTCKSEDIPRDRVVYI